MMTSGDANESSRASEDTRSAWLEPGSVILRPAWSPGLVRQRTLRFGADPRQRVVAFVPKEPLPGPWVFFLFGGDWSVGGPRLWSFAGNWFARHGVAAVLGGYRVASSFSDSLEDALGGFAFASGNAKRLGIAGRPAVLSGASSAGHLAALSAIRLAREAAMPDDAHPHVRADGLLIVNAPLNPETAPARAGIKAIEATTGHSRSWPDADPVAWLSAEPLSVKALPRTVVVRGDHDELGSSAAAGQFTDALNALAPKRACVVPAPWTKHADLVRLFLDHDPPITDVVLDWLWTFRAGDEAG